MRIKLVCFLLIAPLSACQVAGSTHGGDISLLPARSVVTPPTMPARTLSIAEQIASPAPQPGIDLGETVPVYEPFVSPKRASPVAVRVASLDGGLSLGPQTAAGEREIPMLAPLPIVDIEAIRKALRDAVGQSDAPSATPLSLTPTQAVAQTAGLF